MKQESKGETRLRFLDRNHFMIVRRWLIENSGPLEFRFSNSDLTITIKH